MKLYKADIYGRANSIVLSVRDVLIFGCVVDAESPKEARSKGWEAYQHYGINYPITRNDVRIDVYPATTKNSLAVFLGSKLLTPRA